MADGIVIPQTPPLSRVKNVELMHTGEWALSNGVFTFTTEDLYQSCAALACPAVRRPIIKLGHSDPRFDGEPAVGYIDNQGVADNGYTLVGDYTGMPGWLGDIIASAYPDRSIEGTFDFQCQMGHTHPFVVTAVALLGVVRPGIGTIESLQDVAALYGVDVAATEGPWPPAPEPDLRSIGRSETSVEIPITASQEGAAMPNPNPRKVAAAVTSDDVRRVFYETPIGMGWNVWITEIQINPLQVIYCDDDTGDFYRVPIVIGDGEGTDAVSFEAPIKVVMHYDDAGSAVAAGAPDTESIRFATRAESRPGQPPAAGPQEPPAEPAEGTTPTPTPEDIVADNASSTLREELLKRLGVTDVEADEAVLLAALDEALSERAVDPPAEPVTPPADVAVPDGYQVISNDVLDEIKIAAAEGRKAFARQTRDDRDNAISAAVKAGKISVARKPFWAKKWDADPEGTKAELASIEDGMIPVVTAGVSGGEDASAEEADFKRLGLKQFAEVSN